MQASADLQAGAFCMSANGSLQPELSSSLSSAACQEICLHCCACDKGSGAGSVKQHLNAAAGCVT